VAKLSTKGAEPSAPKYVASQIPQHLKYVADTAKPMVCVTLLLPIVTLLGATVSVLTKAETGRTANEAENPIVTAMVTSRSALAVAALMDAPHFYPVMPRRCGLLNSHPALTWKGQHALHTQQKLAHKIASNETKVGLTSLIESKTVGSDTPGSGHLSIIFVTVFIADRNIASGPGNAMNIVD
jgi:hypothetical protein